MKGDFHAPFCGSPGLSEIPRATRRTYNWSLGKPDPASLKVHVGEQASYSVPVTVTAMDSGWTVEGTITITITITGGRPARAS